MREDVLEMKDAEKVASHVGSDLMIEAAEKSKEVAVDLGDCIELDQRSNQTSKSYADDNHDCHDRNCP